MRLPARSHFGEGRLDALVMGIGQRKANWIPDPDIAGFFDAVSPAFRCAWHTNETLGSHDWLVRSVEHRVDDRRVVRLIRKPSDPARSRAATDRRNA